MRSILKVFVCLFVSCFALNTYAINVNVSTSSKVDGIGFTANGSKHGGMGSSYQGSDMPKGNYTFGLRSNGKDVGCVGKGGKKSVKLSKDTDVTLSFNGKHCTMKM
jgi:hypothetical protein